MKVTITINTNTEIVAEHWRDFWENAGFTDTRDSDDELVSYYCREFGQRVQQALGNCEVEYEGRFDYWRGGPGQNSGGDFILRDKADGHMVRVIRGAEYDAVRVAYDEAEAEARAAVAREIADVLEAVESREEATP